MTVFLLIISFIIDGVIIIGMLILSARLKKSEEVELRQEQVAREIEDLFTSYLMEIKEENNRLGQLFEHSQPNSHPQEPPRSESINQGRSNHSQQMNQPQSPDQAEEISKPQSMKVKEYSPPEPEEDLAAYQPSLHSQVVELFNNGNSIEEIARKLDRGKTEIELIVKFHQKK